MYFDVGTIQAISMDTQNLNGDHTVLLLGGAADENYIDFKSMQCTWIFSTSVWMFWTARKKISCTPPWKIKSFFRCQECDFFNVGILTVVILLSWRAKTSNSFYICFFTRRIKQINYKILPDPTQAAEEVVWGGRPADGPRANDAGGRRRDISGWLL